MHNLPLRLTSFVGREREIAEVTALVQTRRLVTLVGAPGVGKTRLSLHVAADVLGTFADGVWLVELAPLADATLVPQAIATVLGVREQPGRPLSETLAEHLRARSLLLLLDNCEHLVGAVAALAEALLQTCSQLQIIATSREPLAIDGEVTWRVPSLTLPDAEHLGTAGADWVASLDRSEAACLFVERAQAATPSFALTERSAPAVAQICARLDGIPLALELAAARVRALSVEQIAARLDDRFRLLTGGSRTALPRQQTLHGAIDWSYDLLSEPEQTLLRRLAVFAGGFTLEAADAVANSELRRVEGSSGAANSAPTDGASPVGALLAAPSSLAPHPSSLDTLVSLVDKSLVQVEDGPDGERRYRMLETLRAYGLEKLAEHGELATARDRHRNYFLELTEAAEPQLVGPREAEALARIDPEYDNLRAALAWCLECDRVSPGSDAGVRIAGAIWRLWWRRGHFVEGQRWLAEMLKLSSADSTPSGLAARARVHFGAANLLCYQGNFRTGTVQMEKAQALWHQAGDEAGVIMALHRIGFNLAHLGEFERAEMQCKESVARARRLGDPIALATALWIAGIVAEVVGQFERSVALCEESLALSRQAGHDGGMVASLAALARAVAALGDLARATVLHEEYLRQVTRFGYQYQIAEAYKDLGRTALLGGDADRVVEMLRLAIPAYRELGDYLGSALCLLDLAGARTLQGLGAVPAGPVDTDGNGHFVEAAWLYAAASALRETNGIILHPHRQPAHDRDLAILRQNLGEEVFAQAWAEGLTMSLEQAADYAMAVTAPSEPPALVAPTHSVSATTPGERGTPEHGAEIARLSGREREVAALITQGLSNRQIAQRLTLSERTVDTHVRHILGKLELTSRAQIAAWTVEHGLTTSRRA